MVICSYMPLPEIWGPIDTHPHIFTNTIVGEKFHVDKYCQPVLSVGIYAVAMSFSRFPSKQHKK
jgi:hypothetical protein